MPRKSTEAKAAENFKAGGRHPVAPDVLSPEAKALWDEIVKARPVEFFKPGSQQLLEQYCSLFFIQREQIKQLDKNREDNELVNRVAKVATTLISLATKLRLSIQSASRIGEGKLDEEMPSNTSLLGGHAVETRETH